MLPTQSAQTEVWPRVCSVSHSQHCPCKVCLKRDFLGLLVLMASFVVVQLLSCVWLFAASWTAACQGFLSFTISWSSPKFMTIESVMLSNHLVLCQPFSFCLQPFPGSGSLPMSQFFTSGGQSIAASASASVLPVRIQGWFPLGWTGLVASLSHP